MSNRRKPSEPVNATGHDSFVLGYDGYGRMHLQSPLPKVVSISQELWAAIEPGLPWATIAGDDLTIRTVEATFTYRRVNGQTDGKRYIWVCDLIQQHHTGWDFTTPLTLRVRAARQRRTARPVSPDPMN